MRPRPFAKMADSLTGSRGHAGRWRRLPRAGAAWRAVPPRADGDGARRSGHGKVSGFCFLPRLTQQRRDFTRPSPLAATLGAPAKFFVSKTPPCPGRRREGRCCCVRRINGVFAAFPDRVVLELMVFPSSCSCRLWRRPSGSASCLRHNAANAAPCTGVRDAGGRRDSSR